MKNKIIVTRGIPASGKTTWATKWVQEAPNRVNINRDDIRVMLGYPPIGNFEQEKMISNVQDAMLKAAISEKKDIVISDTNLRDKFAINYFITGLLNDYEVSYKDFPIDVNKAVKWDNQREDHVGEQVIRTINQKFPVKNWSSTEKMRDKAQAKIRAKDGYKPYKNDPSNPKAILVDIDGTIAYNNGHRSFYDVSELVKNDEPIEAVISAVNIAHDAGYKVVIMSGREDACKQFSIEWLEDHNIPFDEVHFRKTGDQRADWIVKDELVRNHIENNYYVEFCYDDRNQVVEHHRAMGYNVFQVAPGDF